MLTVTDVSLRFSDRKLFDDVNIKFTEGNTYGLIGANGAGKSTFLKILAGDIEPTTGHISLGPDERLSVLRQNHFDYEDERAIDVVIMGNEKLYSIMKEKDAIYMKEDFSDEDGVRAAELEGEFAELGGWEAESEASQLLQNLNISIFSSRINILHIIGEKHCLQYLMFHYVLVIANFLMMSTSNLQKEIPMV